MTTLANATDDRTQSQLSTLDQHLRSLPPLAVAVSGGVDSLTLAWATKLAQPTQSIMVHAVSPAVPPQATQLVKHYAQLGNWALKIIDANEYNDPQYRANPVNRCYFCKTNLYSRIQSTTGLTIATGTNTDDLGDFRPGLKAATQHNAIHPYVDVGINKAAIRRIAHAFELKDVAVLPAQPCLASRVETGIAIDANDLVFINAMELLLRDALGTGDIRCRLTRTGVKIELDKNLYQKAIDNNATSSNNFEANANNEPHPSDSVSSAVQSLCSEYSKPFIGISRYEKGSAFIHTDTIMTAAYTRE